MRWDRLFDELRRQAVDEEHRDGEGIVDDLRDENLADLSWTDHLGDAVDLEVVGVGRLRGRISAVGDEVIRLDGHPVTWLVARSGVEAVHAGARAHREPSPLERRLGWPVLLRALRDEDESVDLWTLAGRTYRGVIDHVGADYVAVIDEGADDGEWDRARRHAVTRVRLAHLAAVRLSA